MTPVATGYPARRIPPLHCVAGLDLLLYLVTRDEVRPLVLHLKAARLVGLDGAGNRRV